MAPRAAYVAQAQLLSQRHGWRESLRKVVHPKPGVLIMTIFYLSTPLMILGIAIAIVPLAWAMKHHEEWEVSSVTPLETQHDEELLAA
jgi:hypothetical protein